VLGFLDESGAVDLPAVHTVLEELDGRLWTFHKAIDHAVDRGAVWRAIEGLPGLDYVLTSGGPHDAATGAEILIKDAFSGYQGKVLVGGGLREAHLSTLRAGGLTAFHTGSAVRPGGSWDAPVDPDAVRRWRELLD
jgi:copper homeostasis protein